MRQGDSLQYALFLICCSTSYYVALHGTSSCVCLGYHEQVIAELEILVKRAIKNSDKRTPFERAQHRVGRVYNKAWYQSTVTGLLVVVKIPPHPRRALIPPRPS